MKVAIYTYSTLPRGSVVHAASLAEALTRAGQDVTLVALDKDRRGFYRPVAARLVLVPAAPTPPSTAELVRVRRRELADHVLAHGPHAAIHHAEDCLTASALLDVAAVHPIEVVRTVHHVEEFADPYLDACQTRSITQASSCVAVSAATAQAVLRQFAVRAHPIGNGVDVARFAQVDPAAVAALRAHFGAGPVVLAVGGIEARKNSVRLLAGFAAVHAEHPGARLVILGGASVLDHGATRAAFAATRAALPPGARAAVIELGVVPDAEVPAIFAAADVLALPSLHEGFGLAALEGLAAGLPVVASRRPPFTEYLDDGCAILVDPGSADAIAAGIRAALRRAPALRDPGRRRAASLSWDAVAARHIAHYQMLAGAARVRKELPHARDALSRPLA